MFLEILSDATLRDTKYDHHSSRRCTSTSHHPAARNERFEVRTAILSVYFYQNQRVSVASRSKTYGHLFGYRWWTLLGHLLPEALRRSYLSLAFCCLTIRFGIPRHNRTFGVNPSIRIPGGARIKRLSLCGPIRVRDSAFLVIKSRTIFSCTCSKSRQIHSITRKIKSIVVTFNFNNIQLMNTLWTRT